ncbi:hypothetical protein [Streptomyces sp. NBC_01233]|uniref:hypothetical protein n=1 Tax=Streptomyces sp. NBC_01233 TaxID=2903787 RepID=UPI002E1515B9|nr:hypothetical protein OG332_16885 [Streptomyces sp. NBC_01233]
MPGVAARTRATLVVTVALAAGVALLSGCAEEKKPLAASKVRPETCFGAFTPSDLSPLLGRGDEVTVDSPYDLRLNAQRPGVTCNIYVDGKSGVLAWAERQPLGQGVFWPLEKVDAEPIPTVENGKVWNTGAAALLSCKGATDSFELELWLSGSVDGKKPGESRPVLVELMKKYADYAKQQTGCGST